MMNRFAKGLNHTHSYLIDMGAKIAPDKNFNFSSTAEGRVWLKNTFWKKLGTAIEVVDNFRYLGAHVNVSGKNTAETLRQRFKKGVSMLMKIARLPVDRAHKAMIIRTKVFAATFYGSEVAQPTEKDIATFAAATAQAIANKTTHHDIDMLFSTCSRGADLDVIPNLVARKCTMLRRAIAKRPHEVHIFHDIVKLHIQKGTAGATMG